MELGDSGVMICRGIKLVDHRDVIMRSLKV